LAYPLFHPESRTPHRLVLSPDEFADAFPEEGDHVEFKRGVSGVQIQATTVAFSNADGGVVLIGVTDDGEVVGRALDAGTRDDIHQAIQSTRDPGRYSVSQIDVAGKPVIVLAISRRHEGFAQTSDGVVRVRNGSRDDPLFGADLVRFANERSTSRYELTPLPLASSAINSSLRSDLARAFGWPRATSQRLEEAQFLAGGNLTVAGALYLTSEPDHALGKAHLELQRFPSDSTIDYDQRREIQGPLPRVLTEAVSQVIAELGTELVVLGSRRYDLPRLPEVVIREAIANALAHRSYEASGTAVRVEIRPSAVIVRSPGGLPEPVTVENIREANAARNVVVIGALRRFGLAEDQGRGVDVMQDTMADAMLDPPRFSDNGHEVKVELPLRSTVAPIERAWLRELEHRGSIQGADRIVIVHAARGEVLTNARVRELLAVDRAGAAAALRRLRDEGFLEQKGQRGGASYRLSGSLRPPAGLRLSETDLLELIVNLARDFGSIANADVRRATGLDRAESLSLLDRLVAGGRLTRSGQRRGTRYSLP
jgi:ATP-dependent DNA helicase RecG